MPKWIKLSIVWLALFFVSTTSMARICRLDYLPGYVDRMPLVSSWIGKTTDPNRVRVYISKGYHDGNEQIYLHSNYQSEVYGQPGTYHPKVSKFAGPVKAIEGRDFSYILANLIFDVPKGKQPPADWQERVSEALSNAEILIDPNILGPDGRPPFDLSGAKSFKLASDTGVMPNRLTEQLNLKKPPPTLIERIAGCCLNGRPAGRGVAIHAALQNTRFNAKDIGLLSMVNDTATTKIIVGSTALNQASARSRADQRQEWATRLSTAMNASRGRSLVLLTHVSKGKVVVENAGGREEFSVPLIELHNMARELGVNLILVGCETAREAESHQNVVGIVGKYNTVDAARRLDHAIQNSGTALDFLTNLSSEGLQIVVQEGTWSANATGATFYSKSKNYMKRAFRVWFLGERDG